jgi:hypothetical protein
MQTAPGRPSAVDCGTAVQGIELVIAAAVVRSVMFGIGAFVKVEDSPVKSVKIQVYVCAVSPTRIAHIE